MAITWRPEHEWTPEVVLEECRLALEENINDYIEGRNDYDTNNRVTPLFGPVGIPYIDYIGATPYDDFGEEFLSPSISLALDINSHDQADASNFLFATGTLRVLVLLSDGDAGTTDTTAFLNILNAIMSGVSYILSTKVGKNPEVCYRAGILDVTPVSSIREPAIPIEGKSKWLRAGELNMTVRMRVWDHGA